MRPIHRQLLLSTEVPFPPGLGVSRNHRDEQLALADLLADRSVPDIPAAKLALIEPNLDAGRTQSLANLLRSLRILRGVAQKYRVRGISHRPNHLGEFFSSPPWADSLAQVVSVGPKLGSWTEGQSVPIDQRCRQCFAIDLSRADARDRQVRVNKRSLPTPLRFGAECLASGRHSGASRPEPVGGGSRLVAWKRSVAA